MRSVLWACLLLATVATPAAAVGEEVDLLAVHAPGRTAAGLPFEVSVELHNKGAARVVYLFAALYEGDPAGSPCGAATDPRFRTYTPLYQARIELVANERRAWPAERDRWQHVYQAEDVEPAPTTDEFCVFVAQDAAPPHLEWLDFESLRMLTRGTNAAPVGDFTWAPASPRAAEDVAFSATGADAEDDPLTFAWDFGHANASGRARAEGAVAYHPFYPDGTFTVTLTVSDGFNATVVRRDVTVVPETGAVTPTVAVGGAGDDETPVPPILALAAAGAAALLRRRSARPR